MTGRRGLLDRAVADRDGDRDLDRDAPWRPAYQPTVAAKSSHSGAPARSVTIHSTE